MLSSVQEKNAEQAEFFANRLKKNERTLRKWARQKSIHALRLYDRDIPEIPLAVDRYDDGKTFALVIALYERPYEKDVAEEVTWLALMSAKAAEVLSIKPEHVFLKTRKRMEGLEQYTKNATQKFSMVVEEAGLKFKLNLSDYLDTGIYSDHRPARSLIRATASGKNVLNLFSYTGAFSVYASAGGASSVCSVDLSNTYLGWAAENFALNGLNPSSHHLVRSDVMAFLEASRIEGKVWDLIIVDPPTFSNSTMAKHDFDINLDWPELLKACSNVLSISGYMLFSTNSRKLRWDDSLVDMPWKDISEWSIPRDYRNTKIHKCWLLGELSTPLAFVSSAEQA